MSSVRLLQDVGLDAEASEAQDWIAVESPLRGRPMPTAGAVVIAIADLRRRYADGDGGGLDVDDSAEYGNGDADLIDAIDRTIDRTWDC